MSAEASDTNTIEVFRETLLSKQSRERPILFYKSYLCSRTLA